MKIVIKVPLGSPSLKEHDTQHPAYDAITHITLREDDTHKRWHVHGAHSHQFPGSGPHWLKYKRSATYPGNIILLNKHGHEWMELENFPNFPNMNSRGTAYGYNLNYPPCQYTHGNRWYGTWWVGQHVAHANLPLIDPNEGAILNAIHSCTRDTGFRYDTSFGVSGSIGAGAGAGGQVTTLVFKRKEPNDTRRWHLRIVAAGVGVMTPGAGVSGSTAEMESSGVTDVLAGPDGRMPFPISDFEGTVLFFEGSAGVGAGMSRQRVGGVGGSLTTYMFIGGMSQTGVDISSMKALVQTYSSAASGGKSTKLVDGGVSGLMYAGVCSVKQV